MISRCLRKLKVKLEQAPILPLSAYQLLTPRNCIGLCYHLVSDAQADHVSNLYQYHSPAAFEQHLASISARHRFISYDELRFRLASGKRAQDLGVFLSFDDGMVECFAVVRPILLKYRIPCTFFITTDFVGSAALFYRHKASLALSALNQKSVQERASLDSSIRSKFGVATNTADAVSRWILGLGFQHHPVLDEVCSLLGVDLCGFQKNIRPYMDEDQIRALVADGFAVGAHSKSHRLLGQLPREAQRAEIVDSSAIVKELTGLAEIPFAFPFSGAGVDGGFLRNLKTDWDFLGLFFDAGGIRKPAEFRFDRILCESRCSNPPRSLSMRQILTQAYHRHWVEMLVPSS